MARDEIAVRLEKLQKLIPLTRELHSQLGAVLEEVDAILGGGAGIAEHVKLIREAFDATWGARYAHGERGQYIWRNTIDTPHIKRLIKAVGMDELARRIQRYVETEDPFIVRARHPFGLFVSGINSYAGPSAAPVDFALEAPAVADCKHAPRCQSDQQHTRAKMAEMRA